MSPPEEPQESRRLFVHIMSADHLLLGRAAKPRETGWKSAESSFPVLILPRGPWNDTMLGSERSCVGV